MLASYLVMPDHQVGIMKRLLHHISRPCPEWARSRTDASEGVIVPSDVRSVPLVSYVLHFLRNVLSHCYEYLYDQAEWNLIASVAELAIGFIV